MRHFFWQTMLYGIVSDGKWMGSRIMDLKSITFCGRRLTRRRIADIQRTVELFPSLSRDELASAICSHLGWRTPKGGESPGSCLRMLHVHVIRGLHAVFGIKRITKAQDRILNRMAKSTKRMPLERHAGNLGPSTASCMPAATKRNACSAGSSGIAAWGRVTTNLTSCSLGSFIWP